MHNTSTENGGKGFHGNFNYCGKFDHRFNECWLKDHDIKAKGGGLWSQKGGGKGLRGQGPHSNGQPFSAGPWKSGSTRSGLMESQRRVLT